MAAAHGLSNLLTLNGDQIDAMPRNKLLDTRNQVRKLLNLTTNQDVTDIGAMWVGGINAALSHLDVLEGKGDSKNTVNAGGLSQSQWRDMARRGTGGAPIDNTERIVMRDQDTGRVMNSVSVADRGRVAQILGLGEAEYTFADLILYKEGMLKDRDKASAIRNSLQEGSGSGQYTAVPSIIIGTIVEGLFAQSASLQAGANVMGLTGDAVSYKFAQATALPAANWVAEAGTVSATDPTFAAITLTPKKLAVRVDVSMELLQDAVAIEQAIMSVVQRSAALALDYAVFRGTGTGQPLGLVGQSGTGSVSMGTNGASWTNFDPLTQAYGTLLTANVPADAKLAFVTNPTQLQKMMLLKDTLNQPLRKPPGIDQLPIFVTSQLTQNETQGSSNLAHTAYLGRFSDLVIGMRLDGQLFKNIYLNMSTGMVSYFLFLRADTGLLRAGSFCKIVGLL